MRIAAHRGSRLHAPENSRLALIAGYTGGADVLEFDLQLTKDGQLVLSHDATIDRLTGEQGHISDLTFADLRKFDFELAGHFARWQDPTLQAKLGLLVLIGVLLGLHVVTPYTRAISLGVLATSLLIVWLGIRLSHG